MRTFPRLALTLGVLLIFSASLISCKAITRTTGLSGARDISPDRFIEYYQQPKRSEAYWAYIGAVGDHYYMEYYRVTSETYPEFNGEIRVPIKSMPADFPAVRQGRPYPPYELPEQPTPLSPSSSDQQ